MQYTVACRLVAGLVLEPPSAGTWRVPVLMNWPGTIKVMGMVAEGLRTQFQQKRCAGIRNHKNLLYMSSGKTNSVVPKNSHFESQTSFASRQGSRKVCATVDKHGTTIVHLANLYLSRHWELKALENLDWFALIASTRIYHVRLIRC